MKLRKLLLNKKKGKLKNMNAFYTTFANYLNFILTHVNKTHLFFLVYMNFFMIINAMNFGVSLKSTSNKTADSVISTIYHGTLTALMLFSYIALFFFPIIYLKFLR